MTDVKEGSYSKPICPICGEVVNLSRSFVAIGDDHYHVDCYTNEAKGQLTIAERVTRLERERRTMVQDIVIDGQKLCIRAPIEAVLTVPAKPASTDNVKLPADTLSPDDIERLKRNIRVLWSETVQPTSRAGAAVVESAKILGLEKS